MPWMQALSTPLTQLLATPSVLMPCPWPPRLSLECLCCDFLLHAACLQNSRIFSAHQTMNSPSYQLQGYLAFSDANNHLVPTGSSASQMVSLSLLLHPPNAAPNTNLWQCPPFSGSGWVDGRVRERMFCAGCCPTSPPSPSPRVPLWERMQQQGK